MQVPPLPSSGPAPFPQGCRLSSPGCRCSPKRGHLWLELLFPRTGFTSGVAVGEKLCPSSLGHLPGPLIQGSCGNHCSPHCSVCRLISLSPSCSEGWLPVSEGPCTLPDESEIHPAASKLGRSPPSRMCLPCLCSDLPAGPSEAPLASGPALHSQAGPGAGGRGPWAARA